MKGIEIRPFVIEDTDEVLDVWSLAGMTTPERNPRADIQKKLRHSPESFFVGTLEGKVVATVMVGYDGHRGWFYSLAVRPDLQRKGIVKRNGYTIEKLIFLPEPGIYLTALLFKPDHGKTKELVQICDCALRVGAPVLFHSLEMPARELLKRLLSRR